MDDLPSLEGPVGEVDGKLVLFIPLSRSSPEGYASSCRRTCSTRQCVTVNVS
jgi:hypothetical protein